MTEKEKKINAIQILLREEKVFPVMDYLGKLSEQDLFNLQLSILLNRKHIKNKLINSNLLKDSYKLKDLENIYTEQEK